MKKRAKKLLFVGIPAVLVFGFLQYMRASGDELGQEQWLQYHSSRNAGEMMGGSVRMNLDFMPGSPPSVRLPKLKGGEPHFMKWLTPMAESGWLWIALDCSGGSGRYDLLYIDSNGNGHLDDETAISTYTPEKYAPMWGPVKVVFQGEDGPIVYHLNFSYYTGNDCLYAFSAGWYEGDITVAGAKKRCRLIDYNTNGAFDDVFEYPNQGDRMRIGGAGGRDSRFVGRYIEVDGVLYRPEIARDGAYVKLSRAENVEFGKVRVPHSIEEFSAGGRNGSFVCRPQNGVASLPVGRYGIERWSVARKDDRGTPWTLQGTQLFNKSMFDVSGGQEAEIAIGEPIIYRLEVTRKDPGLQFDQVVRGKYGDHIKLTCGGDKPRPPRLRIRSKDGTYDRSYDFKYG